MKISKMFFLLILCLIMTAQSCYAGRTVLKTSEDYLGVETKAVNLTLYDEYDVDYNDKIFDNKDEKRSVVSWCQVVDKTDCSILEKALGIDIDYENFNNKWLFVSFGVEADKLEYWSEYKNYTFFDGTYRPVLTPKEKFTPNKVYIYKMDRVKLECRRCMYSTLRIVNNSYELKAAEPGEFQIQNTKLLKEMKLSKSFLYKYRHLKDKNNNLPQLGMYEIAESDWEYQCLMDDYALSQFRYNNYKNKCIVLSFGGEISGFKVFKNKIEPIPTGAYNENMCYIYEMDYVDDIECDDFSTHEGVFVLNDDIKNKLQFLFEQ